MRILPYRSYTIAAYLKALASDNPVPGGGSAAAVSACNGAALLEMVCLFTLKKKKGRDEERIIRQMLTALRSIRKGLTMFIDKDPRLFHAFTRTKTIQDPVQKKQKRQQLLKSITEVPLDICSACLILIRVADNLKKHGNKHLLADVFAAAELLYAAFYICRANIGANMLFIEDKKYIHCVHKAMVSDKKDFQKYYIKLHTYSS